MSDYLMEIPSISEEIWERFDNILDETVRDIQELDATIQMLNRDIRALEIQEVPQIISITQQVSGGSAPEYLQDDQAGDDTGNENGSSGGQSVLKTIKDVGDISGAIGDVLKLVGEFYPKVKKAGEVFETIGNISKGASGLSELAGVAEGAGAVEGITAAGEIATGALGVAEAGAMGGPVGWVIAGGALLVAGVSGYMAYQEEQDKEKKAKDANSLEDLNNARNSFSMTEGQAVEYANDPKGKSFKWHQQPYVWLSDDKLSKAYNATSSDINTPLPLQVSDNTSYNNFIAKSAGDAKALQQGKAIDKEPITKKTDRQRANEMALELVSIGEKYGKNKFEIALSQKMSAAVEHDQEHPEDHQVDVVKDAGKKSRTFLANWANAGTWVPETEGESSGNANGTRYLSNSGSNYGGRTIQININKPMIEHFTISTKDVNEGLGQLKREVEEILLEILDSVK